jgi:regulator of sigma E protease
MPLLLSAGSVAKTVLEFAVFISVIVFFHELGHLVVGKLCGVKALRFSIGFGPKLFGFQWGETEYRVSALPLGGYVKFAGDNPLEELAPADRGRGFLEQPPGKKAAIAFAGPAANFVLAFVLFFAVSVTPHRDLTSAIGYVKPGAPAAAAGIRYGDKVVAVDGEKVSGFLALQEKIRAHAGEALTLQILRDGQERTVRVVPSVHEETNPIETVRQGRIGISPQPRAPELAVVSSASAAGKAGLRDFDTVTRLDDVPIANYEQFAQEVERKLAQGKASLDIEVLHRKEAPAPGGTFWASVPARATLPVPAGARSAEDLGIESADMTIFAVQPGSAAAAAGLRRGDRVLAVQGQKVWWWPDVETLRRAAGTAPLDLMIRRDGRALTLTVRQQLRKVRDETGARVEVPELGASPDPAVFSGVSERIWVRWGVGEAAQRAVADTLGATRSLALGIYMMVTGHISSEAIGGPIMIADFARKAADEGWQTFVAVMAAFSVNLGLVNLLPIPVLDGFHVISAGIESISRRRLSLRFREVANVVGMVFVLVLMLFALKNDIMRKVLE